MTFLAFILPMLLGLAGFVALIAWLATIDLRRRVKTLERELATLLAPHEEPSGGTAAANTEENANAATDAKPADDEAANPSPTNVASSGVPERRRPAPVSSVWQSQAPDGETQTPDTPEAPFPTSDGGAIERNLASRWLVWLGSATTILAGVFLVKYSVENALLPPSVRIAAGAVIGVLLILASEWVRRRPPRQAIDASKPDYVPAALGAAGVATLFGAFYAGHTLYGLMGPVPAFVALALVAFLALGLSLAQGPLIGALGIGAAFALPLLIQSGAPNAWALFPYLTTVAGAGFAINRYKDWHWLGLVIVCGSSTWIGVWVFSQPPVSVIPLAGFALLMLAMAVGFRIETLMAPAARRTTFLPSKLESPQHRTIAIAGLAALVSAFFVAHWTGFDGLGLTVFSITIIVVAILALVAPRLEMLVPAGALATLLLLASWSEGGLLINAAPDAIWGASLQATASTIPIAWDTVFIRAAVLAAIGFALFTDWAMRRAPTPALWAAIGAAMPVTVLAIVYWRLERSDLVLAWPLISLLIAALSTLSVVRLARIRERAGMDAALGMHALAAMAAILLGGGIALEERWMTIFVATVIAASGWINHHTRIPFIRDTVLVLATLVIARLFLKALPGSSLVFSGAIWVDPWLPDTPWSILYGNGVPALAFLLAARWFAKSARDRLTDVLECGALSFAMLLFAMETRYFVAELEPSTAGYSLLEQSLNSIAWMATGVMLYRRGAERTVMRFWGSRVLLTLSTAQILLLQVGVSNPLFTNETVWAWPFANKLALAYALPAIGFAWLRWVATSRDNHRDERFASFAALALTFIFISLQVRQLFHGPNIGGWMLLDAENYTYSGVWLLVSVLTLFTGLWTDRLPLRHAGLGLMLLVSLKVFLWDMASLDGLWRVASFLGLGLSLITVGYLYQRLVLSNSRIEQGTSRP